MQEHRCQLYGTRVQIVAARGTLTLFKCYRGSYTLYTDLHMHSILTDNNLTTTTKPRQRGGRSRAHKATHGTGAAALRATTYRLAWPCHRRSRVQYCAATAAKACSESGLMGACVTARGAGAASATAATKGVAVAHSGADARCGAQRTRAAKMGASMTVHFFLAAACKVTQCWSETVFETRSPSQGAGSWVQGCVRGLENSD